MKFFFGFALFRLTEDDSGSDVDIREEDMFYDMLESKIPEAPEMADYLLPSSGMESASFDMEDDEDMAVVMDVGFATVKVR